MRGRLKHTLLNLLLMGCGLAGALSAHHGPLTVTYSDPGDRAYLSAVFGAFGQAVRHLRELGLPTSGAVTVSAAQNAADFAGRTGEPATIAASTLGRTIRTQRLGALAARGILSITVTHETFHAFQPSGLERWKAEGLARLFSGEAARDPGGPSGLEALSAPELDMALQSRDPARLTAAYREASRRAAALVRAVGWKGAITTR